MGEADVRDWAWDWAKKLKGNIHVAQDFFDEINAKCADVSTADREKYSTVLALTVTAYYEYSTGNWGRERSAAQCNEMGKLLKEVQDCLN